VTSSRFLAPSRFDISKKNARAADLNLPDSAWSSLDRALSSFQVAGTRYPEAAIKFIDSRVSGVRYAPLFVSKWEFCSRFALQVGATPGIGRVRAFFDAPFADGCLGVLKKRRAPYSGYQGRQPWLISAAESTARG
jgi:hypothetical protein